MSAWYNENAYRCYPFIHRNEPLAIANDFSSASSSDGHVFNLPKSVVVDFGAMMYPVAAFSTTDKVYLAEIQRDGELFTLLFRTTASALLDTHLVFQLDSGSSGYQHAIEDAVHITPTPVSLGYCHTTPPWSGWLVAGDLSPLLDLIEDGEIVTLHPEVWVVEPGRIQNLRSSVVTSLNLANVPRTLVTNPDGCSSDSATATAVLPQAECLVGGLRLREGFNCAIRQDTARNAFVISAGVGLGRGRPCEEVPRTPDESPRPNSSYLSGGPSCDEVLREINGLTGPDVQFIPGAGFRIYPDPDVPHQLVIDRALDNFVVCDVSSSVSAGE